MANVLKFLKGMVKDTGRMDQVDGTYRDALNLIVDDLKLNVGNEYGTSPVASLNVSIYIPQTNTTETLAVNPIGQISLLDDTFIVFGFRSKFIPGFGTLKVSCIYKINPAANTSTLLYYTSNITDTGLNFDSAHPITAEFRLSPTQEILIYFTDNKVTLTVEPSTGIEYIEEYNPPRVFNVTKQEAAIAITGDPSNLYGDNKRVEFLNLFMDSGRIPQIPTVEILKGGGVITGAYYLGVAYADFDKTETNVLTVSNPVYIVPADEDSYPRESISGAPNGTQTSKSIKWNLVNVNTEYKYIIPYVIQYSGNAKQVFKLEPVSILGSTVTIVYSGLEKVAPSSIEEAVVDKVKYLTAKSLTQLDNRLYAANLTNRPDLGFQRFANTIRVEPVTEYYAEFDPRRYDIYNLNEGYAQLVYPDLTTDVLSNYPAFNGGGDIYPRGTFGRVPYVHLQGVDGITDSYVANVIVPIQKNKSAGYRDSELLYSKKGYRRGEVYSFYISFVLKDGTESFAYHIPGRQSTPMDLDWGELPNLGPFNASIKNQEILAYDSAALPYQYLDTSYMMNSSESNNMGFWQNKNELYPDTKDFESWSVDNNGQPILVSTELISTNVRHHKMPSNHHSLFSYVVKDNYFGEVGLEEPDDIYNTPANSRVFKDKVRILGIKLKNITIPKFILKQIQGYKVYYAKRTHGNKTIIGQSGVHPGTSYLASNLVNKSANSTNGPFFNIWSMDGHLKYGGLVVSDALWAPPPPVGGVINYNPSLKSNYIGNPVFKFHDFNLLRKRPTIATATHIDIQYVVLMESWRGGYKGATPTPATGSTGAEVYNKFYRSFRSGIGDDSFAWVHQDLGNMINFDYDVETNIYWDNHGPRLLWGNVYIASMYSSPGRPFIDIGTEWKSPSDPGITEYLGEINSIWNVITNQSWLLSDSQTVFMIESQGASYINGLSILKATSANNFKGATYIYNAFGESGIVVSLASGLPMLGGYKSNEWSYVGLGNLMWTLQIYSGDAGALSIPGGFDIDFYPAPNVNNTVDPNTFFDKDLDRWCSMMARGHSLLRQPYKIPTPDNAGPVTSFSASISLNSNTITVTGGDISELQEGMYLSTAPGSFPQGVPISVIFVDGNNITLNVEAIATSSPVSFQAYSIGGIEGTPVNNDRTRPNVYLVNLCSAKTDVFEPFDKQQLIWTGYYKDLLNVNIDTGIDSQDGNRYYGDGPLSVEVAESDNIFGGDTYICKYSYRTTSNLYGLGRFGRGVNKHIANANSSSNSDDYIFGDIPLDLLQGTTPFFGSNITGISGDYPVLQMGSTTDPTGGDDISGRRKNAITNEKNWSKNGNVAFSTIYQFMVESDDNINFRHAGDPEAGVSEQNSLYFDKYTAADVLWRSPLGDLTKMDNILYEDHYSALQDIRTSVPFPKDGFQTPYFQNRVIRSNVQDGNFNDTFRYFLPLEYKDFGVNKGQISNIFTFKALLYVHTERSLFRTKGKQVMELADETQAYVGSGDLFAQEPDELIQSLEGYNGLYNKLGSLVTKDGYIFVSRKSRKIFLVTDQVIDLTNLGISAWARENIPFELEAYGWDPDMNGIATDAPTDRFGFLVSYDPLFKRTIITKRELVPTDLFISEYREGKIAYSVEEMKFIFTETGAGIPFKEGPGFLYFKKGGWTISFSNSLSIWASRHSYTPPLYVYNSKFLYSFNVVGESSIVYEHSDPSNPCNFYGTIYNFEIDCIFTAQTNAVFTAFSYTADVMSKLNLSIPVTQQFDPGFTSFFTYNTTQISGETELVYLSNTRKVDNSWSVNDFRDMSSTTLNTGLVVNQLNTQNNLYTGTVTTLSDIAMFNSEGVINPNYIDSNKPWYEQKKFVDRFFGVRLIARNLSKTLINLYTVSAAIRKSFR